jgi:hypothetical protein
VNTFEPFFPVFFSFTDYKNTAECGKMKFFEFW